MRVFNSAILENWVYIRCSTICKIMLTLESQHRSNDRAGRMRISQGILVVCDRFSCHVGLLAARIAYTEAALDLQLQVREQIPKI